MCQVSVYNHIMRWNISANSSVGKSIAARLNVQAHLLRDGDNLMKNRCYSHNECCALLKSTRIPT